MIGSSVRYLYNRQHWTSNGRLYLWSTAAAPHQSLPYNTNTQNKQYLQGFASRDSFKGIVFVKTRRGVAHLANMVRRCDQLAFLDVYEFAGHGGSNKGAAAKKKRDDGVEESKVERGLTGKQQVAVIEAFRGAGRKLLISTSAAEEGLDIPTCEFVVRYNSANTGIQRVQSRGRSRALGSEFICIVQRDSLDLHLHKKSHLEEVVMKRYLAVKAASSSASASKGGGGAVAAATTGGRAAGSK